ncbi:MAG TPA: DedA family protein [Candidatus Paceibacterota bacterium]|nr:DedA family protein [Candidatus Paceibacterota bacterium]
MSPAALLTLIATYRYLILVPAALLADVPADIVSGIAVRLGYLSLPLAYICLMLGEIMGDVWWYWVGYFYGEPFARRFGRYVGITGENLKTAEAFFRKYGRRILISSKLTSGFGFAVPILFAAGLSRLSFWRFLTTNLAGQFLWTGGLVALGYFFGDLYLRFDTAFERASIIPIFVILIALLFGLARFMWSRVSSLTEAERA